MTASIKTASAHTLAASACPKSVCPTKILMHMWYTRIVTSVVSKGDTNLVVHQMGTS